MRLLQQDRRASANNQLPRNWTAFVAKCHAGQAKRASMSPSGTSAMRNEGGCHQVPRLPRKVPRCHRRPAPPKRPTRASPVCATPATQRECRCHQVPHWMSPRATPATQRECRCHPSATPATRNEGECHQVPRLPCKVPRCHRRPAAPKRPTRASPVP